MTTQDRLAIHEQERAMLLQRITETLRDDQRIVAAWLSGSLGAGNADALSDIDVWAAVDDAACAEVCAARREYSAQVGAPVLILDGAQNAPAGGAALLVFYPGTLGILQVDWYWVPQSMALLPPNAHLLFKRGDISVVPASPLPAAADIKARLTQQVTFFWAMLPIIAKYILRHNPWKVVEMLRLVERTLEEVKTLVGLRALPPTFQEMPRGTVPADAASQVARIRQLAQEMEALSAPIMALGGEVPAAAIAPIYRWLELVASDQAVA
jgi:hypothetical protein